MFLLCPCFLMSLYVSMDIQGDDRYCKGIYSSLQLRNLLYKGPTHFYHLCYIFLPTLKKGVLFARMSISSPVFGFLPFLALCFLTLKLPNPLISIFSPFTRLSFMLSRIASTIISTSLLVKFLTFSATFSTRLLFIMLNSSYKEVLNFYPVRESRRLLSAVYSIA